MEKPGRGEWAYVPAAGQWDECLLPSGFPRRPWRTLAVAVGRMGKKQLARRWQMGRQLIKANGVTYNVYGDPQGKERPWVLDPIPMVIGRDEWASIERAVAQRASLLNAILADLYGPRQLIHQRNLPAELLFASQNFLRPCFDIKPQAGVYLHSFAADLVRSPSGSWWVISDRTQAPSGVGYALENRLVSARTLSAVFNQSRVRPLNRFFEVQRDALQALAPNGRTNPRVVLLTPGPDNETYFEHSFLARHWGFPLVEGADLTVRGNRVFLKTLAGLEPVDMVLRRMDDSFCDPLELRGDSLLGIPGFTQAVRTGNVGVANALGSGLMETSAHMAFLPGLCRHLLGEELRMPSVATWWCGQDRPRSYVKEHLEELVIKPAFPGYGQNAEFPAYMDAAARQDLIRRIEADPERFVAQEQIQLSTAPVHTDGGLTPRHVVMRVFAAWDGHSYIVLPGALTRVSTEASSPVVSMQLGGGSKDTWVLGARDEAASSSARQSAASVTAGVSTELPSRVADNLFWLGRYAERVEAGVRLVRALLPSLSGEEDFGRTASLDTAVQLLVAIGYLPDEFPRASLAEKRWQVERLLASMVYDPGRTSGIGANLRNIRRVTWPLKERLSNDTWRVLQDLETLFSATLPLNPESRLTAQMTLLDRAIVVLSAFSGLLMENTTRGPGWHFLEIGRRLERAMQMSELLMAAMAEAPFEFEPSLETLLQIADSSITYRSRYFTSLSMEFVLELLLADETNPRSLRFQLETIRDHVRNLPGDRDTEGPPLQEAVAERLLAPFLAVSAEDVAARDFEGNMPMLEEMMRQLKGNLYDLSDALTARHFSHVAVTRLPGS